jgi:hypothetical protein
VEKMATSPANAQTAAAVVSEAAVVGGVEVAASTATDSAIFRGTARRKEPGNKLFAYKLRPLLCRLEFSHDIINNPKNVCSTSQLHIQRWTSLPLELHKLEKQDILYYPIII